MNKSLKHRFDLLLGYTSKLCELLDHSITAVATNTELAIVNLSSGTITAPLSFQVGLNYWMRCPSIRELNLNSTIIRSVLCKEVELISSNDST